MSVSFVAGTNLVHGELFYDIFEDVHNPLTAALPTGLADGDKVLAFVFARATVTVPSGWTLVAASSAFDQNGAGLNSQTLRVYSKDTVTAGNSGANVDWRQSDPDLRLGVFYGAFRGAAGITATSNAASNLTTYVRTPPTTTATGNGQMLVCVGSTVRGTLAAVSPTFPASFTRFSGNSLTEYRIAAGYRAVNSGQSNSGDIDMAPGETMGGGETTGLGTMTLLIEASGVASAIAYVALSTPLGAVAVRARTMQAARIALGSPLGAVAVLGYHNIAAYVVDQAPTRWVMDLVTPSGLVRAPISSWQATLQTGAAQYLNCVIPNPGAYTDAIAAATEFRVAGLIALTTGNYSEFAFAAAPVQTVSYARGGTNRSATLSGYSAAAPTVTWPTDSARNLKGVRTVYTGDTKRVLCSVDWSLRPGQTAYLDGVPFVVGYINYSISDSDQLMTVGERTETG